MGSIVHVLIGGCGWLGLAVARACAARGDRVTGVRRGEAGAQELRKAGIDAWIADLSDPRTSNEVPPDVDVVVACQSADDDTEGAYRRAYLDANRTLLSAARRLRVRAFVYTGSTGVFGQSDGSDVDETTPASPVGPTAAVLAEAEELVLEAAGVETRLVRLSGLYGPARSGILERVRSGRLALGPGDDVYVNLCHRDDAVATVLAAVDRGRRGGVYHGTDAHPARRREIVEWVAARIGIEPTRLGPDQAPGTSRRGANRRILGERTRAELGLTLRFPSFREGLAPLLPEIARGEAG